MDQDILFFSFHVDSDPLSSLFCLNRFIEHKPYMMALRNWVLYEDLF